ncbi:unnamed protein product [Amoebophrya sp. A120]|nr:unnamed protein product [Amoebophrya sp. A120]|eukprot:GSA120T00021733001.1
MSSTFSASARLLHPPTVMVFRAFNQLSGSIRSQYTRNPNLAPLGASFCLFGLSDVLAQTAERRHNSEGHENGPSENFETESESRAAPSHGTPDAGPTRIAAGPQEGLLTTRSDDPFYSCRRLDEAALWDFRRTLGVALCAPFFNGGPLLWFHRALDRYIGPEASLRRAVPKMLAVQFLYMPISTPAFLFLSKFFVLVLGGGGGGIGIGHDDSRRTASCSSPRPSTAEVTMVISAESKVDDTDAGAASFSSSTPIQSAFDTAYSGMRATFWESYVASFFFWPLSDLLNFTVIQRRFGPHFRTTWDSVVDLGWNFYLSSVTFRRDPEFLKWSSYFKEKAPSKTEFSILQRFAFELKEQPSVQAEHPSWESDFLLSEGAEISTTLQHNEVSFYFL